jgi:prepilin-type N-terminal cleavage/methylation domain-containing protein
MIRNQRGFMLLEVLVAIVLFSVAILLFSSVFVSNFQQSKNQETQLVAINLARQVASEWGNKSYDEITEKINPQNTTTPIQYPVQVRDEQIPDQYSINERTYQSKVTINKLDPILIITVEITSPGSTKILATVHSSVGK